MSPRLSYFPLNALRPRALLKSPALFHTTTAWRNGNVDHYETLGLEPNASSADIKKQFYALSKQHHPDHNRNDSKAAERFVKISEAYAVLGSPSNRERYDKDTHRASGGPASTVNRASHSSSGPYGSRPASGLSRRRTQFRGPPPSFYRNGGWGSQGAKRASQAEAAASSPHDHAQRSADPRATGTGGIGTGGSQIDWININDVPHFDHAGHYRTQEQQEQRRMRRIRKDSVDYEGGGSLLINFILIVGVISIPYLISTTFHDARVHDKHKNES